MFVNIGTKRNKWFEIDGTVTSEPDLDMVFFVWLSLKKKKKIYLPVPDLSCGMQDL